ncbi:MAG: chemotaxis protein CheB [Psychroserpens sp.]|uniref:chemotaxis protein CheB n=1 Tax=Psychroserpens sp. TaxID=2020870 RepID=UPI003C7164D7
MSESLKVVGIGASAGGLDAIQKLFDHIPNNTGMTFIIIQHLSPDFKSLMPELLAKHTDMLVYTAQDKMAIKPNCIYLNTSKKNVHVKENMLYLLEKGPRNALNLPIDIFFHTLGEEFNENAVGIILSGTGSDGSRGIRTVKSYGGTVIVQDPNTAQFDGMPNAAIETGMYDFIKPPENMINYLSNGELSIIFSTIDDTNIEPDKSDLNNILNLVFKYSGIDFREYKKNTLIRRIEKRMQINKLIKSHDYYKLLVKDKEELIALKNDFLIGVTHFFRDTEAFDFIEHNIIPELFSEQDRSDTLRIWLPGCSTGEEAYSFAMLLDHYISTNEIDIDFKIFATDVDDRSLAIANLGEYPINVVSEINKKFFDKYVDKSPSKIKIIKRLREKILFSHHNIIKDPPFIKLDLISCRNLLIYLDKNIQERVMQSFQFGLNSFGYLFLGKSESLGYFSKYYKTIDAKSKIYQSIVEKKANRTTNQTVQKFNTPQYFKGSSLTFPSANNSTLTEDIFHKVLSNKYAPSSIFIDKHYNILFIKGEAAKRLQYNEGMFERNLLKVISEEASIALRNGISLAKNAEKPIKLSGLNSNKDEHYVFDVKISHITDNIFLKNCLLIEFSEDREKTKDDFIEARALNNSTLVNQQIEDLESQLKVTSSKLQHTVEELETSNEELQSSNEELMSSNEELQSTNEELQSTNEELFSVNSEMYEKNIDLKNLNNDITNLFDNTKIATLFLDEHLSIRKFTPAIKSIFNLNDSDLGRTIDNFTSNFDNSTRTRIINDSKKSLKYLETIEDQVNDKIGNYYLMRISPFITTDEADAGVIVTFDNINKLKEKEKQLNVTEKKYKKLFTSLTEGFIHGRIITNKQKRPINWEIIDVNQAFEKQFKISRQDLIGNDLTALGEKTKQTFNDLFETFSQVAMTGKGNNVKQYATDDGKHYLINTFSSYKNEFASTFTDVTELHLKNQDLIKSEAELERIQELTNVGSWVLDINTGKVSWSKELYRIYGRNFNSSPPTYQEHSSYFSEQDWKTLTKAIDLTLETGTPYELELEMTNENGQEGWIWVKGEIYQDIIASSPTLRGSAQDITLRKKAEFDLLAAKKEAVIANTHKDYFLANMSHEIRTPVTSIIGFSELLKDSHLEEDERNKFLKIIDNNSKKLINLIDDIIDITKIESNKIDIVYEDCNISELLKDLHTNYNHVKLYKSKEGVTVSCHIPKDYESLIISTDPSRLEQVLANLLNNAIKFSTHGEIKFGFNVQKDIIKFYVKDEGIGIPEKHQSTIFDRFKQVNHNKNVDFGGTGLGLSICKSFIELMGGEIWVESEYMKGSNFYFTVPLNISSSSFRDNISKKTNFENIKNKKLLIAEDSKIIQLLFKRFLEEHSVNLIFADNGQEALDLYESNKNEIDLVLLDIRMPKISGIKVLSEILKKDPDTKVIMQSAHTLIDEKNECFDKGCVDFLHKPIIKKTLFHTLAKWL